MPDIVTKLRQWDELVPPPSEAARVERQSPAICRSRLVLPAPFGPVTSNPSPGCKREAQVREQVPAAALAGDLMGGKAGLDRHLLRICASWYEAARGTAAKALLAHCLAAARALI